MNIQIYSRRASLSLKYQLDRLDTSSNIKNYGPRIVKNSVNHGSIRNSNAP